jgi:hypothetical protein
VLSLGATLAVGRAAGAQGAVVRGDPAIGATASPFALPGVPSAGPLRPLGGLLLDNVAIRFGGLSGLHLDVGLRLTAICDLGRFLTARLVLHEDGAPTSLAGLRTGRLRDGGGAPLPRGSAGDAESLARLPDGTWLVGFERWHRIRAHRRLEPPTRPRSSSTTRAARLARCSAAEQPAPPPPRISTSASTVMREAP